nr:MAG: hypothetical protein [Totiviridae sp.]
MTSRSDRRAWRTCWTGFRHIKSSCYATSTPTTWPWRSRARSRSSSRSAWTTPTPRPGRPKHWPKLDPVPPQHVWILRLRGPTLRQAIRRCRRSRVRAERRWKRDRVKRRRRNRPTMHANAGWVDSKPSVRKDRTVKTRWTTTRRGVPCWVWMSSRPSRRARPKTRASRPRP